MPIRTPWSEAELRKLAKLHNIFADPHAPPQQRKVFRLKIEQMLREHGCDPNVDANNADLRDLLRQAREALEREDRERAARNAGPPPSPPATAPPPPPDDAPQNGEAIFNYIVEILERFAYFRVPEYRYAIAAWAMHAHVHRRFKVTPRLHLKSVVFGEGKTTIFDILEKLVPYPERDDSTTPAIIADRANQDPPPTFLLDEADNLGLMDNPLFRAVLNSGYGYKGRRTVMGPKRTRISTRTFAPMALASIRNLPGPLMRRSIIINMRRVPSAIRQTLIKFDENDVAQMQMFRDVYAALRHWAYHIEVNPFPEMPVQLPTLPQEAWAPLVAVADACSLAVGDIVRRAAITIAGGAEEPRLLALGHMFEIFNLPLDADDGVVVPKEAHREINRHKDQLTSETVIATLHRQDPVWEAWCGEDGTGKPHPITHGEFARLFKDWRVRAKPIWSHGSRGNRKCARGWRFEDFVELWSDYEIGVTPSHASKVIDLARHSKRKTRRQHG
jgi:hypothetical protein